MKKVSSSRQQSTIFEHLLELRTRLVRASIWFVLAFVITYAFKTDVYAFLVQPLAEAQASQSEGEAHRMIYTSMGEAFFTYIKMSMFAAFVLAFPMISAQIYLFIAPGLYKREKRFLLPFVAVAPILFFAGAAFVYYFIMPLAMEFFLSFESSGEGAEVPIELEAKVSEYLSFVMHMVIGFGLAFQLPIILMLLAKTGLMKVEYLQRNRRIAVVVIFVVAAILTPPDVISQTGLAVMLMALYELSIIGIKMMVKR